MVSKLCEARFLTLSLYIIVHLYSSVTFRFKVAGKNGDRFPVLYIKVLLDRFWPPESLTHLI